MNGRSEGKKLPYVFLLPLDSEVASVSTRAKAQGAFEIRKGSIEYFNILVPDWQGPMLLNEHALRHLMLTARLERFNDMVVRLEIGTSPIGEIRKRLIGILGEIKARSVSFKAFETVILGPSGVQVITHRKPVNMTIKRHKIFSVRGI